MFSELGKLKLVIKPTGGDSTPPVASEKPPLIEVGDIRIGYTDFRCADKQ
jgi:hypothetical protein